MTDDKTNSKTRLRRFIFKAFKATIKGVVLYAIYFVFWMIMAPLAQVIPGLQQMIEAFIVIYITFTIIGTLAQGTIFEHFFNVGKALFVILYLILSLKNGVMSMTFEGLNLMVDLRFFVTIAVLLGLLGLSKSVLQAVNFMHQKEENSNKQF